MKHKRVEFYVWEFGWHSRLLPSIEYTDNRKQGLAEHYGYRFTIGFRWLHYCLAFYI